MQKKVIKLANVILWDPNEGDKVYLDSVQIVIERFPFATRQVFVRFASGPSLDFSIVDMDRLAIAYLLMRGVELPIEARHLAKAKPPPWGDFIVPKRLLTESWATRGVKPPAKPGNSKKVRGAIETARSRGSTQRKVRKARDQLRTNEMQVRDEKVCSRCAQMTSYSGEWNGDLCPDCADKTEGDWVCRRCGRRGNFEEMGGNGANNPRCCASRCKHVKPT